MEVGVSNVLPSSMWGQKEIHDGMIWFCIANFCYYGFNIFMLLKSLSLWHNFVLHKMFRLSLQITASIFLADMILHCKFFMASNSFIFFKIPLSVAYFFHKMFQYFTLQINSFNIFCRNGTRLSVCLYICHSHFLGNPVN